MSEYEAATFTGLYAALWSIAACMAVYVFLTAMVLYEIRKFDRWSEQRFREHTQRHAESMRALEALIVRTRPDRHDG